MLAPIKSIPQIFTIMAVGLLLGLGFHLAGLIVAWPTGRVAGVAALIGVLILIVAWLI